MKIVLSRKGFDSTLGKIASPVLPDGRLVFLPIPSETDSDDLSCLPFDDYLLGSLIRDLSKGRLSMGTKVHYDPDLDRKQHMKSAGWRPAFGQRGSALGHLKAQKVGSGDIFLFFGWFRRVEESLCGWRYVRDAPDEHVVFGWLEVADVILLPQEQETALIRFPWLVSHPHFNQSSRYGYGASGIYVGGASSEICGAAVPSGGLFSRLNEKLVLTKPGFSKSVWQIPAFFGPVAGGRKGLTYHQSPSRWTGTAGETLTLRSVAKGQEFVCDIGDCRDGLAWVKMLVGSCEHSIFGRY